MTVFEAHDLRAFHRYSLKDVVKVKTLMASINHCHEILLLSLEEFRWRENLKFPISERIKLNS